MPDKETVGLGILRDAYNDSDWDGVLGKFHIVKMAVIFIRIRRRTSERSGFCAKSKSRS